MRSAMVAIWIVLLWPLPAIITFRNPVEAQVLGRYTLRYFAVMLAYLSMFAVWTAITGWAALRLSDARLARLRQRIEARSMLAAGAVTLVIAGLAGIRVLRLADLIGFPPQFLGVMVMLPGVLIVGFVILAVFIVDVNIARRLEHELGFQLSGINVRWVVPTALVALVVYFVISLLVFDGLAGGGILAIPVERGCQYARLRGADDVSGRQAL